MKIDKRSRWEYFYLPAITIGILWIILFVSSAHYKSLGGVFCPTAYPNPSLTPGKANTSDFKVLTEDYNEQTYSQSHRNVPESVKKEVLREYGVISAGEIDHFISLGLGGSNSKENLWPEAEHVMCGGKDYGFRTKDRLESYLILQMKNGKIKPIEAQNCLKNDWIACLKKYGLDNNLGGIQTNEPIE